MCERVTPEMITMLERVSYPYLRQPPESGSGMRIEVGADSMRVGKTTAAEVIAEGLVQRGSQVFLSYEDWLNNPYLADSYGGFETSFLSSQKWFAQRKHEQIFMGSGDGIFLQDVHPEMDYCYSVTNWLLGRMSEEHFAKYDRFYRDLAWSTTVTPTLLVYLMAGDDKLIQRAQVSAREFETIDSEYLLTMKEVNRRWLSGAEGYVNILRVDTDDFDFSSDEGAKDRLVEMVMESVGLS